MGLSGCIKSRYQARTVASVVSHWPLSRAFPGGANRQAAHSARQRSSAIIAFSFRRPLTWAADTRPPAICCNAITVPSWVGQRLRPQFLEEFRRPGFESLHEDLWI